MSTNNIILEWVLLRTFFTYYYNIIIKRITASYNIENGLHTNYLHL